MVLVEILLLLMIDLNYDCEEYEQTKIKSILKFQLTCLRSHSTYESKHIDIIGQKPEIRSWINIKASTEI